MTARHHRMRGQTLMVFTLGFALFLFAITCLVADTAFLFRWSGEVQAAAQLAAQSGADAVDPHFLYSQASPCASGGAAPCAASIVDVSPQDRHGSLFAFQRACIQSGDQSAGVRRGPDDPQTPDGTACASDGCTVFAIVTRSVALPIPLPGFPSSVDVRGESYAAPVVGATSAQTSCSGGAWVPARPAP